MSDCLSYSQTNRFSILFNDYIEQKQELSTFYNRFPLKKNFRLQIEEKLKNYNNANRDILADRLLSQYKELNLSAKTKENIHLLRKDSTFTITTGHQLNLFTGPLYTFYKVISVIKSCRELKVQYPEYNFVPIFWLASEDHDFEEINHFYFQDQKISWSKDASGVVGELDTHTIENALEDFKAILPEAPNAKKLIDLFENAYLKHSNLSGASIYLYNELFGEQGLVILEPNHSDLKSTFTSQLEKELLSQTTYKKVIETSSNLKDLGYHEQVTPREINLFYKGKNIRERIIFKDGNYFINDTDRKFSKEDILNLLKEHPEQFSPNALLRPLYQEVLLPNLSYVGGAGELAYWLQLKSTFDEFEVTFPMLQMRDTALLFSHKTAKKLEKLNIRIEDLFQSEIELKNKHVKDISEIKIDFTPQKEHLSQQFEALYKLAEQTDKTFLNAVAAQEQKQHNGLDKLEKRLLKAQRKKLKHELDRLIAIQQKLFPRNNLQERIVNFSELYFSFGDEFLDFLFQELSPFDYNFSLIEIESIPLSLNHSYSPKCI